MCCGENLPNGTERRREGEGVVAIQASCWQRSSAKPQPSFNPMWARRGGFRAREWTGLLRLLLSQQGNVCQLGSTVTAWSGWASFQLRSDWEAPLILAFANSVTEKSVTV